MGPNGFFREFIGSVNDPNLTITCEYERSIQNEARLSGNILLNIINSDPTNEVIIEIIDHGLQKGIAEIRVPVVKPGTTSFSKIINLEKSSGWYDFSIRVKGYNNFEKRYAGRVETGKASITDPVMGRV